MRLRCIALVASLCAVDVFAEDPVVLYGRVFPLFELTEVRGGGLPELARTRLSDGASRLGVIGREALGSGVTAWFRLETAFLTRNPAPFADRNSGIGINFPLGTIVMGRWSTPFDSTQSAGGVDPFYDSGLANITTAAINQGNFARRVPNVIQYWSPPGPGWRTRLMYQTDEIQLGGATFQVYGASVAYTDEKNYFAVAYEKHLDQARVDGRVVLAAGFEEEGYGVAGYRHLGPVKVGGQYGLYRATGKAAQRSLMFGLQYVVGAHEFLGSYQRSSGGGDLAAAAQPQCSVRGAGYRYRFSARTYVIVYYAQVDNAVGALCTFGEPSLPTPISAQQDLRALGLGLHNSF